MAHCVPLGKQTHILQPVFLLNLHSFPFGTIRNCFDVRKCNFKEKMICREKERKQQNPKVISFPFCGSHEYRVDRSASCAALCLLLTKRHISSPLFFFQNQKLNLLAFPNRQRLCLICCFLAGNVSRSNHCWALHSSRLVSSVLTFYGQGTLGPSRRPG